MKILQYHCRKLSCRPHLRVGFPLHSTPNLHKGSVRDVIFPSKTQNSESLPKSQKQKAKEAKFWNHLLCLGFELCQAVSQVCGPLLSLGRGLSGKLVPDKALCAQKWRSRSHRF